MIYCLCCSKCVKNKMINIYNKGLLLKACHQTTGKMWCDTEIGQWPYRACWKFCILFYVILLITESICVACRCVAVLIFHSTCWSLWPPIRGWSLQLHSSSGSGRWWSPSPTRSAHFSSGLCGDEHACPELSQTSVDETLWCRWGRVHLYYELWLV